MNLSFRMARKNKYDLSILIVCEGTNTEPTYFQEIWESILLEDLPFLDYNITISPKPKLDKQDISDVDDIRFSRHKKKREGKKRKFRKLEKTTIEDLPIIEDAYKAQPIRYVREAQKGLEDGTYDEVWAVFDKDGHPKHKKAFELAEKIIEGKTVNIAFSSIAFEHWVLLHFEANKTEFLKSECKEKKKPLKCGTGLHPNDCYGSKCVIGYLRTLNYLPEYTKGAAMNIYPLIAKNTQNALENAAWLRHQTKDKKPIYELNP
ncbi:MAG: RloB family protein, partial [Chitinophagales bacterium]